MHRVAAVAAGALIAGSALIAPAATAQAVDGITAATLSGAKVVIPLSGSDVANLNLTFTAPQDPTISYTAAASVSLVKSPIAKSKRKLPSVSVPATLTPGTANQVTLQMSSATSRGDYLVSVKVTQLVSGVATATTTVKAKVVMYHSAANSQELTTWKPYRYWPGARSKLIVQATAPKYMAGAKVTIKYSIDGTHLKTIGTGKVGKSGGIKVKTKKVRINRGFYIRMIVSSRPYAQQYDKWGRAA